ncbi:ATP-binding protein [Couchioplanes caeruleus]|uniref:ATP-binding protein n=1 Tax=Couchioplanes caeruleus TaxID=56438 RepID=UPI0011605936|nr:ATP-binding protein [Couchioplanes caeruleus]
MSRVLRACVTEAPRMLLVDLTRLQDEAGESASTWQTAARYAMEAKLQVTVVLCAAGPAVRQRLSTNGCDQAVTLVDTASAQMPSRDGDIRQQHLALPAQPAASALARTMVTDACLTFDVAHLVHPARLIVSELVANAVEHTGTDVRLWVSVRGSILHLAVQDGSRELPHLLDTGHQHPAPILAPGTGLRLVSAAATAWGALPCRRGKAVWATLTKQAGRAA